MFFDESSGGLLTSSEAQQRRNQNRDAEEHQSRGVTYFNQNKFEDAYNEFRQAYSKCSSGYTNEQIFMSNRKKSQDRWARELYLDGIKMWNEKNFKGAADKFRLAHEKVDDSSAKSSYKVDIAHAESAVLNGEANNLRDQGRYSEAVNKYDEAINRCPSSKASTSDIYKSNKTGALDLLAKSYYDDGIKMWNQSNFSGAAEKFELAFAKAGSESKKKDYKIDIAHAESAVLNGEGIELRNQGRYSEAFNKYNEAINRCPSSKASTRDLYQNNKAEVSNLWGLQLLASNNFEDAKSKFRLANSLSEDSARKNVFDNNYNQAQAESLNHEGDRLFQSGYYSDAMEKYKSALQVCPSDAYSRKTKIRQNLAKATNKTGQKIWQQAWTAEENNNADQAKRLFKQANDLFKEALKNDSSNVEYQKFTQISGLKIEGNEKFNQGVELHEQANELKKKRKFQEARNKYQEAKNKFQEGYQASGYDTKFKTCVDLVQSCIDEVNNAIKTMNLSTGTTVTDTEDTTSSTTTTTTGVIDSFKKFKV